MQKITTFLWFNDSADEAMEYYTKVFKDARIVSVERYPDDMQLGPHPNMAGKVLHGVFELAGLQFACIDGGPDFTFNEAISLMVHADSQEEIDYLWEKLSHVPEAEACGWCKDKFGISWQIVPSRLGELMQSPAQMQALMGMKKISIADLESAGKK